jgi:hypothetical protein
MQTVVVGLGNDEESVQAPKNRMFGLEHANGLRSVGSGGLRVSRAQAKRTLANEDANRCSRVGK